MTIARRLILLLAVPLGALPGLGIFVRLQLSDAAKQSRFVTESWIEALATIGNLSRTFVGLRGEVRSYLLAADAAARSSVRALESTVKAVATVYLFEDRHLVLAPAIWESTLPVPLKKCY